MIKTNNINYYFYIMTSDYGFAPNPFYGFCTLACCKPHIRKHAKREDWVIGLGSKPLKCRGNVIFAMEVTEILTFTEYYKDKRFLSKQPKLHIKGVLRDLELKAKCGDNVYYKNSQGKWIPNGGLHQQSQDKKKRCQHLKRDTKVDRVLISDHFFYFGNKSLTRSNKLFNDIKEKMKNIRNFRYKDMKQEGQELVNLLKEYEKKNGKNNLYGEPINWKKDPAFKKPLKCREKRDTQKTSKHC